MFQYDLEAETACPQAHRFRELHTLIEAYLVKAYALITATDVVPDGRA